MEYYAAIKNDEFMSFIGTWMNLETIILSKLTQEQKMKSPFYYYVECLLAVETQVHILKLSPSSAKW